MDEELQAQFQEFQDLDVYCQNGTHEDVPLSNEFLDGCSMAPYQATALGGLLSPNSSIPDFPRSDRESPLLPSLSPFISEYGSQARDESFGAHDDYFPAQLLQHFQESHTDTDSNTINNYPGIDQNLSDETHGSSETQLQHEKASMTSSSHINAGQYQGLIAPPEGVSSQDYAATVPSNGSVEQITSNGRPSSTHVSIAPKAINNTSSTSAPASLQHSPTSKSHHFVRCPSHLRHQIHPELPEYSPFATTAAEDCSTDQPPHTMSPSNFINCQDPNALSSHGKYQNVHHPSNRPRSRRVINPHNQSQGSPALQPFQESSLRSSVASISGLDTWEAAQFQTGQYPDPHPMFQQQPNRSPYTENHHISGSQGSFSVTSSPEQFCTLPSSPRSASFMRQGSADFIFNGSSPLSMKRELSSPDSDHLASTPILNTQRATPKPQKKQRVKAKPKHAHDNEEVVNPNALQTADLTNLDLTDQSNVAALISAMHNTENVEDNVGMQRTWEKIRTVKASRIKEVCVDLLNLTKQAQQQEGIPLGEKKPINHYASFEMRFESLCDTLKFQKTVCKHLIEPPYSYAVVDDPVYAKERVENNRRVNLQKAEAIRLGREHLGEKGQGKGKPPLKVKKRAHAQMEDSQDDGENSGDEPLSDAETSVASQVPEARSVRRNPRTAKKTKRSTNSIRNQEHGDNVQTSCSPEVQNSEDSFAQDLRQNARTPFQKTLMLSEHDRMLYGLTASPQMRTLNQRYDFQTGNGPANMFCGDTASSDSDGLGTIGCEYN